ncbi:coagulase domain-containing protein [Staphylococcus lutrae]|uniref:Staphylocoagulase N-terminal subdomain 1 domain-containing protein n=1 Tax=Staphylococcus lutrae TaxID=155085 RepID=A0AAC9WJX6_9STAP|nr:coagulase domain-containing protein [Staphylococcus lutrae]ARJ51331.1 hypothetical protein B5P37_08420 [Staphylococcus lutrae]PNZ35841.1 coagulase [Staphylococcus lutrae]
MRKKLFVLSASAILASHIATTEHASAIVSGEENPYRSKALDIQGHRSTVVYSEEYRKSLERLVDKLTIDNYERYDQPEFKEVVDRYKNKFMAEAEAINLFLKEEKMLKSKNYQAKESIYGLTYHRYIHLYNALESNKNEFLKEIEEIANKKPDLKTFDENEQEKVDEKLNRLENQVLMLGSTFIRQNEAVQNLYTKLDLIIGYTDGERNAKRPVNQRMVLEKTEDLEAIIDEFFEEIDLSRPMDIPALSKENEKDNKVKQKLRDDAKKAKEDKSYRHPRALKKAEMQLTTGKHKTQSMLSPSKQTQTQDLTRVRETVVETDFPLTKQVPTYVVQVGQKPIPTLQQASHTETFEVEQPSPHKRSLDKADVKSTVPSMNGINEAPIQTHAAPNMPSSTERLHVTSAPISPVDAQKHGVQETITESNLIDIEETSHYSRTGTLQGVSISDTSGYTERDKRAIRRNHVREAEEKVNQYVDTHKYQDRITAQQKVNMLSEAHQKYFNKKINRAYNGG